MRISARDPWPELIPPPRNNGEKLHRLFRLLQQRNRFIASDLGTELSPLESLLLLESDSRRSAGIVELAALFGIDKSIVSRAVQRLSEQNYLKTSIDPADARRRRLEVTTHGKAFLAKYDKLSNQVVEAGLANLKAPAEKSLTALLRGLADGLEAEAATLRKIDHRLRVEMRRLTHALGLLRPTYMESPLSMSEWQVLAELTYHPQVRTATDVVGLLTIPQPVLSLILKRLEEDKLVGRSASLDDRRHQILHVTARGVSVVREIEVNAGAVLLKAMREIPDPLIAAGTDALISYIGPTPRGVTLSGGKELVRVATEEQVRLTRGALLESLVTSEAHYSLADDRVVGNDARSFVLLADGQIAGILELPNDSDWPRHLVIDAGVSGPALISAAIQHRNQFSF